MYQHLRWLIVLATFMLSVLLYVDRVCISAAKDAVATELHLSEKQMGWVFSAFALGYALFQTPSGWLADRWGPRRTLALIAATWSLFTGLTAVVSSWSSLLVVRFLFGAGEAGAFPGMSRAIFAWIPMHERGTVQGINFSGSRIGAAVALPLITWLIVAVGWRVTFVGLLVVGLGWALTWFLMFRDEPATASWLTDSEREYIQLNRQHKFSEQAGMAVSQGATVPLWHSLLRSPTMWALCAQYFASNFVFYFGLTWFFPQLKTRYGLTGMEASLFAAVPMICGAIGNWTAGWWVDRLYSANRWRSSRRLPAMTGFLLAAIGIIGSGFAASPMSSSFWFSMCIFGADMTLSPSWSTCVDIGTSHSGVVSGTMNMAGNLGAFVTSLAFPYLLGWTGSPLPFFFVAAVLNVVAVAMWLLIEPTVALEKSSG